VWYPQNRVIPEEANVGNNPKKRKQHKIGTESKKDEYESKWDL
jgi:hypothetical protein